jgi:hypothetical protein
MTLAKKLTVSVSALISAFFGCITRRADVRGSRNLRDNEWRKVVSMRALATCIETANKFETGFREIAKMKYGVTQLHCDAVLRGPV